jgi:hypothetical protein
VANKARTISLEFKILRDVEFFKSQLNVPTDGKGFWVGKKSLQNWRRLAKVALEDKIITEVQEWQLHKNSPQVGRWGGGGGILSHFINRAIKKVQL